MRIELTIEEPRWTTLELEHLADKAILTSLAHLGLDTDACEISLLACNDARIAGLNAGFRQKDIATNVLSWPAFDLAVPVPGTNPDPPKPDGFGGISLGDVAISWETCSRESHAAGKDMGDHVTHLLVHGVLHLLGYDHIRDADATLMMKNEVAILGKLGIPNPY